MKNKLTIELSNEMRAIVRSLKSTGLFGKTDAEVVERLLCEKLRSEVQSLMRRS